MALSAKWHAGLEIWGSLNPGPQNSDDLPSSFVGSPCEWRNWVVAFCAVHELRASCPQSLVLGSCPGYPGAASDSGCRAPGPTWRLAVDQQGPFGQSNLQKSTPIPVISGVTHLPDCQTARNAERLKIDKNCQEQRFVKLSLRKKENCPRKQCHPCTSLRGGPCRTWSAVWKC